MVSDGAESDTITIIITRGVTGSGLSSLIRPILITKAPIKSSLVQWKLCVVRGNVLITFGFRIKGREELKIKLNSSGYGNKGF